MPNQGRSSKGDYKQLKLAVEAAGFFADFEPIEVPGDRLCVASERFEGGVSGVLFWIAKRGGDWFVATYLPHIYCLPETASIIELTLVILRSGGKTPYDFPQALKSHFLLYEISEDEFSKL